MRIVVAAIALLTAGLIVHAEERPQPLTDRPVPVVKLKSSLGWRLSGVATMDVEGDAVVLVIAGDVYNISDQERPSPALRLGLSDANGREIYHITTRADRARIPAHDWASFETRIKEPPGDARSVEIRTQEAE